MVGIMHPQGHTRVPYLYLYVSQPYLLAGFWSMWSLFFYLEATPVCCCLSLCCYGCAFLSKAPAVMIVALFIGVDALRTTAYNPNKTLSFLSRLSSLLSMLAKSCISNAAAVCIGCAGLFLHMNAVGHLFCPKNFLSGLCVL